MSGLKKATEEMMKSKFLSNVQKVTQEQLSCNSSIKRVTLEQPQSPLLYNIQKVAQDKIKSQLSKYSKSDLRTGKVTCLAFKKYSQWISLFMFGTNKVT